MEGKVSDTEESPEEAESSEEEEPAVIQPAGMDTVEEAEWQTPHPSSMRDAELAAALTIFQPRKTRTDPTVHDCLHLLTRYTGPGAFDSNNNPLPLDWETYNVTRPWSRSTMNSEELQRLGEEDNRRRAEAEAKTAAAAANGGWGNSTGARRWGGTTSTISWGAGSSTEAGAWGIVQTEEEEEPIEEFTTRLEKEAAEEARGPYLYHRYPNSPLPTESMPIGPHDPNTAGPSTTHGLPPHHVPRPNLPEGIADTDDPTTPLADIAIVEPAQQLTPRDLIPTLGLSISPQPIPQPPPTKTPELLTFYARSPATRAPPNL
ncbi:unnamed protein product [Closterium sp. Naga37s-1]|nr:unnamed protein product [Closterium sp. Naga37s-1]